MQPFTSVIIPAYDDDIRLEWLLESLCRQTATNFEVIVVNDGGDDATIELCHSFLDRLDIRTCYVEPSTPDFRAALARNTGARASRGRILHFMDCDAIQPPNAIAQHQSNQWFSLLCSKKHYYNVGCGGRRDIPQEFVAPFQGYFNYSDLLARAVDSKYAPPNFGIFFLSFNLSINADLFCDVGGFDETFTGWGNEDVDLRNRLNRYGAQPENYAVNFRRCVDALHLNHAPRATHQPRNGAESIAAREGNPIVANGGPLVRMGADYARS